MTDAPKDTRIDMEFLIDRVVEEGFNVVNAANGGFIIEAYESGRGTVRAAFTNFDDLIAWLGSAFKG